MNHSPEVDKIIPALCKAQGEFVPIAHNATGAAGKDGARKYGYADLGAVLSGVRQPLAAHGLCMTQSLVPGDAERPPIFEATVWHESGQWIRSSIDLHLHGMTPQDIGKLLTYFRRYLPSGLLSIATEQDTDAQGVEGGRGQRRELGRRPQGRGTGPPPRDDSRDAAPPPADDDYPGRPESWVDWVTHALNVANVDFANEQKLANVPKGDRVPEVMTKFSAANVVAAALMQAGFVLKADVARDDDPTRRDTGKAMSLAAEYFARGPDWAQWVKDAVLEHFAKKRAALLVKLRMENPNPPPALAAPVNGAGVPH